MGGRRDSPRAQGVWSLPARRRGGVGARGAMWPPAGAVAVMALLLATAAAQGDGGGVGISGNWAAAVSGTLTLPRLNHAHHEPDVFVCPGKGVTIRLDGGCASSALDHPLPTLKPNPKGPKP